MQPLNPVMTPATGERLQRHVGDVVRFGVRDREGRAPRPGWRALLRTNLGRADLLRREIIQAHTRALPLAGEAWHDVPMVRGERGWELDLPLAEPGYFKAKAYLVDEAGWQHWPAGPDVGISVHPDIYRTGNVIYCAFTRLFGKGKSALSSEDAKVSDLIKPLDQAGYAVIPPSGKLRELQQHLPHIFDVLGCRILHLLPVNPTPVTYARFGRYGSPYAALDLRAIDPALVTFDKRTTGVDQFRELTYATHLRGGRVILDIVINHTGWGSVLQENHPEWFLRQRDGEFASPGAWGTVWEDLVEMKHENVALWDELAETFLEWCRRGVDGFRCDAGYMVPVPAWQYIVARVQQEYPNALFLLEGLGGAWEATEALLTEGGMQWAYSELFQNYSGAQVSGYLDHSLRQSERVGLLVHYSETHDNERLAAKGRGWSLLRNRLCGLMSVSGGFGFTTGVEWLATEKIRVHGATGLAWGRPENLVAELAQLNRLLLEHPCFYDGALIVRLSAEENAGQAWLRCSAEGLDTVLVVVNTDPARTSLLAVNWPPSVEGKPCALTPPSPVNWTDLLGQTLPEMELSAGKLHLRLLPGVSYCLAPTPAPLGRHGEEYRRSRAQAVWALQAMNRVLPAEQFGSLDWRRLAAAVEQSPGTCLAAISELAARVPPPAEGGPAPIVDQLMAVSTSRLFPRVIVWTRLDLRRVTPVPPGHWLLLEDEAPFRATLDAQDGTVIQNVESVPARGRHVATFPPRQTEAEAILLLERYAESETHVSGRIRFLPATPSFGEERPRPADLVLLTNGRGAMARLCVDLGRVTSKYDCVLGANLHPALPVDRHVFVKRIRVWVNANGFISPLDFRSLESFEAGPPARWSFVANAGDGHTVQIQLRAVMLPGRNTTVFQFHRPGAEQASGKPLPAEAEVRLTVRLDIEDRSFHGETRRNGGAEHHFTTHTRVLAERAEAGQAAGFVFTPAPDRQLRVCADAGRYHPQPEWSENIAHPLEQSRGQVGSGDAYSPGWFDLPLGQGAEVLVVASADPEGGGWDPRVPAQVWEPRRVEGADAFEQRLRAAVNAFVVRRDEGKTVIAGYPWFLDWGRDTFICARGLLTAGLTDVVQQVLLVFARFEQHGTLPNTIFGTDASNRDTTDAPLWFAVACEELARQTDTGDLTEAPALRLRVDPAGRTLVNVLESIARYYIRGTPNGIRMDEQSGLIWSPSHFTWMDTNYPAGTPRQGYPVEIQALWVRLLRLLEVVGSPGEREEWGRLAEQAHAGLEQYFWREDRGYYADVLRADAGVPAAQAVVDDALRSNCLFVISLGLTGGERARRCVDAVRRYLVIPGGLRSLAPLPVSVPLPIYGHDGRLLNNPTEPYWGRYQGEEDTQRKPAYHNGTGWTWTLPVFCEALARAWEFAPEAVEAAQAYLGSMGRLMTEGCLGHIPENLDGDAPHAQRGCDAQAWGATEALRVWRLLGGKR